MKRTLTLHVPSPSVRRVLSLEVDESLPSDAMRVVWRVTVVYEATRSPSAVIVDGHDRIEPADTAAVVLGHDGHGAFLDRAVQLGVVQETEGVIDVKGLDVALGQGRADADAGEKRDAKEGRGEQADSA